MNILLAVCGSISAYKSYELLRSYIKEGFNVKVILTKGSTEFVNPNVFHYLGAQQVYHHTDDFNANKNRVASVLHIELTKWMDKLVIAPLSANTLAKFSSGICDDLLTSVFLANPQKNCFLYPAMNTHMYNNQITRSNLQKIESIEYIHLFSPATGALACGDKGIGKLIEVEEIFYSSVYSSTKKKTKKLLIATGATTAPLDNVRYLVNPSTGKTGIEIAKAGLIKGYEVDLVCGHDMVDRVKDLRLCHGLNLYHVNTTDQMYQQIKYLYKHCHAYISPAAICDLKFNISTKKLKKKDLDGKLHYEKAIDILKTLGQNKKAIHIGFAAESEFDKTELKRKLEVKNLDLIIGNIVHNGINGEKIRGFKEDHNEYYFQEKVSLSQENLSKKDLAKKIITWIEEYDS